MSSRKFIYEIPSLFPIEGEGPSGYGFCTSLDPDFAILARSTRMEKGILERLQRKGEEVTGKYFSTGDKRPYKLIEDSFLLHFVDVPGNACSLSLSLDCMETLLSREEWRDNAPNFVEYIPHNIDSLPQAQCLLALWLHWANTANLLLNKEL